MVAISIIVPVYNSEKYLARCVDSILQQTFQDFELILVNDCSTDTSAQILADYQKKDQRVICFTHTENKKQGAARNTGLAQAKGVYIGFVDSDDYIAPTMYEYLYTAIEQSQADIVECSHYRSNNVATADIVVATVAPGIYLRNMALRQPFSSNVWSKLIRRAVFVEYQLRFPENMFFEDMVLVPQLMSFSKSIQYIPDALYYYDQHHTSTMHSITEKHIRDSFTSVALVRDFSLALYDTARFDRLCRIYTQLFTSTLTDIAFLQLYSLFMQLLHTQHMFSLSFVLRFRHPVYILGLLLGKQPGVIMSRGLCFLRRFIPS